MAALVDDSWEHKAACRGPQATVFFPPPRFERKSEKLKREAKARNICSQCSVASDCLNYALRIRAHQAIWGGKNEAERRQRLLLLEVEAS